MFDWIHDHEAFLEWLVAFSVFTFVGSLLVIPWLISRMPVDYFMPHWRPKKRHPIFHVFKNLVGVLLIVAGIAMLFLPGLLSIFLGISLIDFPVGASFLDFPGKRKLELRIVRRPRILKTINWLRARAHQPPLDLPSGGDTGGMSHR